MIPILSSAQCQKLDRAAIDDGILEETMMQKAGEAIALATIRYAKKHHLPHFASIVIGKGNNGGDGVVAGIALKSKGWHVEIFRCFDQNVSSPLSLHFQKKWNGDILPFSSFAPKKGVILDGIFGVGFHGQMEEEIEKVIETINEIKLPILAIDVPSGLGSSCIINANVTFALGFPKIGFYLDKGPAFVGQMEVLDYGLESSLIQSVVPSMELLDERKIIELLPKADPLAHKYTKGYLLIIGGSRGMYGAPKLSSLAALRTGCGIVRFYYPKEDEAYLGEMPLEVIHTPLSLEGIGQEEKRAGALLIGPGINAETFDIGTIQEILGQSHLPLIIDGGALPLFSQFEKEVQARSKILTPHRGEALKILGIKGSISDEKLIEKMVVFCTEKNAICVLKGAVTFLISKGRLPLVIPFGSVALATAGSGDVLAGMIASFVAKKISLYESAILGIYLHQLAGRWARHKESEQGVIASDLIEAIPHVYSTLLHTSDKTE